MRTTEQATAAPSPADRFVDDLEAGAILGLSPSYLRKLRVTGGGPAFCKLGHRAVRYRLSALYGWASGKEIANTSQWASV
jgi:hypothetical protein